MSCVEYLRWQLRHCNSSGRKPENSPKPHTLTLGTKGEVSLSLSLWNSPSLSLEQYARSHINNVTNNREKRSFPWDENIEQIFSVFFSHLLPLKFYRTKKKVFVSAKQERPLFYRLSSEIAAPGLQTSLRSKSHSEELEGKKAFDTCSWRLDGSSLSLGSSLSTFVTWH